MCSTLRGGEDLQYHARLNGLANGKHSSLFVLIISNIENVVRINGGCKVTRLSFFFTDAQENKLECLLFTSLFSIISFCEEDIFMRCTSDGAPEILD